MDTLSYEKAKYTKMWECPEYRLSSPALRLTKLFDFAFNKLFQMGERLIDFGCGSGKVAPYFLNKGLSVDLVDIAPNCLDSEIKALLPFMPLRFFEGSLWDLPRALPPAEWVICVDVLEHIPEELVEPTLASMAEKTVKGGLLQIYLDHEPFGDLIGDELHLTVKPREWWVEKIAKYWDIYLTSPERKNDVRFNIIVGRGR